MKTAATTLCALVLAALGGCSAPATHHDDEPVETSSEALSASDPVSAAVGQSCSTTSVKGLAQQLVDEIQCMRPGTLARIDTTPGLSLGPAVFPWMQAPAASALASARSARGKTMAINSALRTLPQQYLLYRWYQTGRCGIGLAARPGTSNHESALAVDVQDDAGWRSAMSSKGFRWLGASDPVHFDYTGAGVVDLRGLSVKAFQRLWNRNHPTDTIAEDGDYGPATEARLAKAPVGGFAQGASCTPTHAKPSDAAKPDASADDPDPPAPTGSLPTEVPVVPDATEPPPATDAPAPTDPAPSAEAGCRAAPSRPTDAALVAAAGLAIAAAVARRRGRRPRRDR